MFFGSPVIFDTPLHAASFVSLLKWPFVVSYCLCSVTVSIWFRKHAYTAWLMAKKARNLQKPHNIYLWSKKVFRFQIFRFFQICPCYSWPRHCGMEYKHKKPLTIHNISYLNRGKTLFKMHLVYMLSLVYLPSIAAQV